ncbi:MAG TPA: hypothetical protein PKO22_09550 [Treponemataceae bacterium]|nr:hypothetical protein [Treponemataceae bacterium]
MKRVSKVLTFSLFIALVLSISSCDLLGFGTSILEPEPFTPFQIEPDFFAVDGGMSDNERSTFVIDVGNDRVAGCIHMKIVCGWGVPDYARVINDRVYICSCGMPGAKPPRELWSITPSTGSSRRIALPYPSAEDPAYLAKANKIVIQSPWNLTVIDFATDTVTQSCPISDEFFSIFETTDGNVYALHATPESRMLARLTFNPFSITDLTPARSYPVGRLHDGIAVELPNGNIVVNDAGADQPQITLYSPTEGRIINTKAFTYEGVSVQHNNKYPSCLQMYNNGNVLLVGHGYGDEDLWETGISIHDPETLEIKGWITGEYVTPSFYVRRDKLYCVGDSHIYVRDLKTAGYPLLTTIELK